MTTAPAPKNPKSFSAKRLEQLVAERADLTGRRSDLDDRIKEIDSILTAQLDVETHEIGDYKVIVTQPRRLDSKALAEAFPVAKFPEYYAAAISTEAVKADISPNALAQFQTVGRKQIRIK